MPRPDVAVRLKSVDVLRAIAVLLVLGRHSVPCPTATSLVLWAASSLWIRGGWMGVDLFFVLSGFLLSGLLFREFQRFGSLDIVRFLVRRGFKIYPAFWLLIAYTIWRYAGWPPGDLLASELLFVQNYFPSLWGHTWSLAVEEHFYFCLALLFAWLAARRRFGAVPWVFAALAASCLGLRLATAWYRPFSYYTQMYPSHLRLDSLFFGVLLSYLYHQSPDAFLRVARTRRGPLLIGGAVLLSLPFFFTLERTPFVYTVGLSQLYLGSGMVLVASLGFPPRRSRAIDALAYIGSHSYSIYLWHMAVRVWIAPSIVGTDDPQSRWFTFMAVYLAGSLAIGIAMAALVEFPVLRLRDRWFPSRARLSVAIETADRREEAGHLL